MFLLLSGALPQHIYTTQYLFISEFHKGMEGFHTDKMRQSPNYDKSHDPRWPPNTYLECIFMSLFQGYHWRQNAEIIATVCFVNKLYINLNSNKSQQINLAINMLPLCTNFTETHFHHSQNMPYL